MAFSELETLDEVLECALALVSKEEEYRLIPLYARHLRAERLTHWLRCALRGFDHCSEQERHQFYKVHASLSLVVDFRHLSLQETQFWLEEWEVLRRQGFRRLDDPEGSTMTMIDVTLSNLEVICRDVSFSHRDR